MTRNLDAVELTQSGGLEAKLEAINHIQAIIEFSPGGEILDANANFLKAMGYERHEIVGQHHRIFVEQRYAESAAYEKFWNDLRAGRVASDQFRRFRKDGSEIWIQAAYSPLRNKAGDVVKVIKFATDISEQKRRNLDYEAKITAIDQTQAMIEFTADGKIITANENFLAVMGYSLEEVEGRHHRMFVDEHYATTDAYRDLWRRLGVGAPESGVFRRQAKGGKDVWIQATYTPITDSDGRVVKVVKLASDVTEQRHRNADFEGKMNAIDKVQAVIEFEVDGTILTANKNFLAVMGYALNEVQGRHHSMFVEPAYARSAEYTDFWRRLRRGEASVGDFRRKAKDGSDVWIQASYTPVCDSDGRVLKVVKFATDITEQRTRNADFEGKMAAVDRVQAIIDFEPDGTILTANENFLATMGYSLDEIQGHHHRMFVEPSYATSQEYARFWQRLREGEAIVDEFERIGKNGRRVWIAASYNPIRDPDGNVSKVVKFATDITERVNAVRETNRVARAVRDSVETMMVATTEIQKGNSDLNDRTQSQAAALEETSASIHKITASIQQNANDAAQAHSLVGETKAAAGKGQGVVDRAVSAMHGISRSSDKIADIIGVIDEIAFQTNLLALNADVEAARAGEQGRGFAVVATEVRNLAQRSANAAQQIKTLIKDSAQEVHGGTELVRATGSTFSRIVKSVERVYSIVGGIASESHEQAEGMTQVNAAVAQLDKTTQQNASMSEQINSATGRLTDQARSMRSVVAAFKLDDEESPPNPSAASPVRSAPTPPPVASV